MGGRVRSASLACGGSAAAPRNAGGPCLLRAPHTHTALLSQFEIRQLRAHLAQQGLDLAAEREAALLAPHVLGRPRSRFHAREDTAAPGGVEALQPPAGKPRRGLAPSWSWGTFPFATAPLFGPRLGVMFRPGLPVSPGVARQAPAPAGRGASYLVDKDSEAQAWGRVSPSPAVSPGTGAVTLGLGVAVKREQADPAGECQGAGCMPLSPNGVPGHSAPCSGPVLTWPERVTPPKTGQSFFTQFLSLMTGNESQNICSFAVFFNF